MEAKRSRPPEELLKDPTGEISELRKMGITDYAIMTYVVRVLDGQPKNDAIDGLLLGRQFLTEDQKNFVRTFLTRLPTA